LQDAGRGGVIGMVAGEETFQLERAEGVADYGLRGFGGESFPPKFWKEVETELEDLFFEIVGAEPAATGKFISNEKKDGPVLKLMGALVGDFAGEAFVDLEFGERAAEGLGDVEVAPEGLGQGEIFE
jgi:hypothetical protein